jgi:hypothetical protein
MIPTVSLPTYSEQFLALRDLLYSLQTQANSPPCAGAGVGAGAGAGVGAGADVLSFKGIIFVEQVAMTYPLTKLINEAFSSKDPVTTRSDPIALPVCGSDMCDTMR